MTDARRPPPVPTRIAPVAGAAGAPRPSQHDVVPSVPSQPSQPSQPSVPSQPSQPSQLGARAVTLDPASATPPPVQSLDLAASTGTPPPPKKIDPYVGKTIDGRYLVEGVLGEGGMGIVYRGRHKVIDKRVAIKVLRGEMAADAEITERFLQEARAASAIGNPHIIDISDFGQLPDGSTYFVMEYLDGKSLGDLMNEKKPIPVARLCHIGKQIANGLAAAHTASIIHRDLKPDNIMLINRGTEKDFVKVLDFGIAKVGTGGSKMTKAGSVFGTPHYMSPEQAAGAVVDLRTDIYALGVILYEMASGKVPFDADNFMGILTQHMYKAPVPIRALVPQIDIPAGLDAIIMKSLTKKAEGRYSDMSQLVAELEKLEMGLMPDAVHEMMARSGGFNVPADYFRSAMPAPVPATPAGMPRRRWPLYAAIFAVCSAVGVVAVIFAKSASSTAHENTAPSGATNATGATPPNPTTPASAALSAAGGEKLAKHKVLVGVTPSDATITRDGKTLGPPPVELQLADGEDATLVLKKEKYDPQIVVVKLGDGATQNFALTLSKPVAAMGGVGGGGRPPVNMQPTSTGGGIAPPPTSTGGISAPTSQPPDPFHH